MTTVEIASLKKELRNRIRLKRQQLSTEQMNLTDHQIYEQFRKHSEFQHCHKIATYLSQDNETGTEHLIEYLFENNIDVYLPKLYTDNSHRLHFSHYFKECEMVLNQYQILEPLDDDFIQITDLDLILLPLTAFDLKGHRLGMGGGYYDRTLAQSKSERPLIVGLAYDFQEVEICPVEETDQAIDMILTPSRLIDFRQLY